MWLKHDQLKYTNIFSGNVNKILDHSLGDNNVK
jgi:hypothetical protein